MWREWAGAHMNGQYHMPIQGHMNGKVGVVVAAASSAPFMGVIGLLAASIPMKGFIGGLKPGIIGIIGGIPMKGVRAVSASRDIADVSFVAGFSASFTWRWVRFADAPRSAIARSVTRIFCVVQCGRRACQSGTAGIVTTIARQDLWPHSASH